MSESTGNAQGQEQSYMDIAKSAAGVLGGHAQLGQGAAQVSTVLERQILLFQVY